MAIHRQTLHARRLVVMVKEPRAGRVKTRLARQIGSVAATSFYRQAAAAVVRRLSASSGWKTCLAVAPDETTASRFWPRGVRRIPQGRGDLGQRMQRIMHCAGPGPIIIIGTDIPAIRRSHIAAAFQALSRGDAVLGPTPDGGYWLVGLKRSPRIVSPFRDVRWSSEHAYSDTARNLAGLRLTRTTSLADVDDAEGWGAARSWAGRITLPIVST